MVLRDKAKAENCRDNTDNNKLFNYSQRCLEFATDREEEYTSSWYRRHWDHELLHAGSVAVGPHSSKSSLQRRLDGARDKLWDSIEADCCVFDGLSMFGDDAEE